MGASGCCAKPRVQTVNTIFATTANCVTTITTAQTLAKTKRIGAVTSFAEDEAEESRTEKRIKWKLGEQIGEGTYGCVYQGLNIVTGELLAIKRIRLDSVEPEQVEKRVEKLKKEVGLLKMLTHQNVVRYVGTDVSETGDYVDILMEFVAGGSIKSLIQKYSGLDEAVIRCYALQILKGLMYLHENRIIHRDLKGANILLTPEGVIKLTDFGSAAQQGGEDFICRSMKGSPYWMAPEVVKQDGHTTKADIWSFGCVLIEMRSGVPPWSNQSKDTKGVLKLISAHNSHPTLPADSSPGLQTLIASCLMRDPSQRPDASTLLEYEFFQSAEEA